MKRLVAFALLAILGMCSIGSAQARLAVPHIPLQPPQSVQPQIMPALLSDKCDLCVSVLTAIAKLASLNNTQVHHLSIEFSNPPPPQVLLTLLQAAIIAYVETICGYLPQEMQTQVCRLRRGPPGLAFSHSYFSNAQCEEMVQIGTPVLINFLIEEMGPKLLCQVGNGQITLCERGCWTN